MTKTLHRTAAVAALLGLPLGLSACGDSSSDEPSQAVSSPAAAGTQPGANTAETKASEPAAKGGKPTKPEVQAGFKKYLTNQAKADSAAMSDSKIQTVSTCVIDKTYDKLSIESLVALKKGDPDAKLAPQDQVPFSDATFACEPIQTPG